MWSSKVQKRKAAGGQDMMDTHICRIFKLLLVTVVVFRINGNKILHIFMNSYFFTVCVDLKRNFFYW